MPYERRHHSNGKGDEHDFEGTDHDPFSVDGQDDYDGKDVYIIKVDSRKDAEMLAEMLKDFYESKGLWDETATKKVISIVADSHNYGDHRVMIDVDKQ